jgi:hypothetical protein
LLIRRARGVSRAKTAVLATVVGALVFGLNVGYLAWTNSSFPVREKQFTIVYHVDQVKAQPGNIGPSNFACKQPPCAVSAPTRLSS